MSVGRRCVADPELVNHGEDGARGLPTGSARLGPLSAGAPPTAGRCRPDERRLWLGRGRERSQSGASVWLPVIEEVGKIRGMT